MWQWQLVDLATRCCCTSPYSSAASLYTFNFNFFTVVSLFFFFASHFTFARRISRFIFSVFSIVHCVSSFCVESSNRTTTKTTTTTTTGVSAIERESDSADPQRRLNGSRARNRMSRRATSSNIKRAPLRAEALHHQRTRAHASALSHTRTLSHALSYALSRTRTHTRTPCWRAAEFSFALWLSLLSLLLSHNLSLSLCDRLRSLLSRALSQHIWLVYGQFLAFIFNGCQNCKEISGI